MITLTWNSCTWLLFRINTRCPCPHQLQRWCWIFAQCDSMENTLPHKALPDQYCARCGRHKFVWCLGKLIPYWLLTVTRFSILSLSDMADIVAIAMGFIDGLGWGSNTKGLFHHSNLLVAASEVLVSSSYYNAYWNGRSERLLPQILPLGTWTYLPWRFLWDCGYHHILWAKALDFLYLFPFRLVSVIHHNPSFQFPSHLCCLGLSGHNCQIAENMVKTGKSFWELEELMLQGQNSKAHKLLTKWGMKRKSKSRTNGYPLFEAVWKVCYQVGTISQDASNLIAVLCRDYHLLSLWNCYKHQL